MGAGTPLPSSPICSSAALPPFVPGAVRHVRRVAVGGRMASHAMHGTAAAAAASAGGDKSQER